MPDKNCYNCLFAERLESTADYVCRHKHVGPPMALRAQSPYIPATVKATGCMRWMAHRHVPADSLLRELIGPGHKGLSKMVENDLAGKQQASQSLKLQQVSLFD